METTMQYCTKANYVMSGITFFNQCFKCEIVNVYAGRAVELFVYKGPFMICTVYPGSRSH